MWQRALGSICETLDLQGFLIGAISPNGRHVELTFSHRAASHAIALLERPLADPEHNPWLALPSRHPLRRVATINDIGGQKRLESTRIWREFYVPLQFGDCLGAVLERQPESADVLITGRHASKPISHYGNDKRWTNCCRTSHGAGASRPSSRKCSPLSDR